jgi:hypothetical protein
MARPGGNPHLVPGNPGNSGGKKGRSGPKPIAFLQECDRIAREELLPRLLAKIRSREVNDPTAADDPGYRWAGELVVKYSQKLPAQITEQTGKLDIRIIRGGRASE